MIMNINSRIMYSILFFSLLMILIIVLKPRIMFTTENEIKHFGLKSDETIYSFGVFTIVSAIFSFYTFCLIDMIFS